MGVYGPPQMPIVTSQFSTGNEQAQPQPQPPMTREFYAANADISPTCLPVQSIEGPSALELGSQISLHQPFDMHALRSIPEADRSTSYHPNAVMQSFMAATAGASYMQNHAASLPPQDSTFSYNPTGLPYTFSNDLAISVPNSLPAEQATASETFNPFSDFGALDYPTLSTVNTTSGAELHHSTESISSEPSPFSGAQSNVTTQSSGPSASSVTSIASVYSGWTDEQNSASELHTANEGEDPFDHPYNLPQASASDHALFWPGGQGAFSQADLYQHANASAQAILSSPDQSEDRKPSMAHSDLEAPPTFSDDMYSRRNSSTTNLASNIEAIHIQNSQTPDGFKQPNQPSSIAARRQKRPTALNPSTFRSASYTSGMPSPGANPEHTLRRIRSSGIPNAAGRVQKPNPGSAQRSPMAVSFADAAASPKFARTFSASSAATMGQGGSLAPPTPLTPGEMSRFPSWQSNTVIRNHQPMPEHGSPESLNIGNWSTEPQSAGIFSNGASPSSTTLDLAQLNQVRLASDNVYRDTPPQSAPATQQTFPRATFVHPPQMRAAFHSTTDLTIAQPKPSHFRRPSLPDGHVPLNEVHMRFPVQLGDLQYDEKFGDMSLNGITHNVPFAPPACMPEFLVHEYSPPQGTGPGGMFRRTNEPQPKSYIFANQGPGDFR